MPAQQRTGPRSRNHWARGRAGHADPPRGRASESGRSAGSSTCPAAASAGSSRPKTHVIRLGEVNYFLPARARVNATHCPHHALGKRWQLAPTPDIQRRPIHTAAPSVATPDSTGMKRSARAPARRPRASRARARPAIRRRLPKRQRPDQPAEKDRSRRVDRGHLLVEPEHPAPGPFTTSRAAPIAATSSGSRFGQSGG